MAAAVVDGAWIVKVVIAGPFVGVTDGGLKLQFAPVGKPEHAKVTPCLNPFWGVTVSVIVPAAPALTLTADALMESE